MDSMIVLTVKRDGGTQDVLGFYAEDDIDECFEEAKRFMLKSVSSRRAIVRIELYNPFGSAAGKT